MTSPNYTAYVPGIVFVDDVGGSGGTNLNAADFNALANYLATYVENHINGIANNHATADLIDAQLPETTAYANSATLYYQSARNDMFALLFKQILGGTGTLTQRIAAFLANTGGDLASFYALIAGGMTGSVPNTSPNTIPRRDTNGFIPILAAGASLEAAKELAATQSTPTANGSIVISGGRYLRKKIGGYTVYGGGTLALPAAPASGSGLYRWDVVFLRVNESNVVTPGYVQGTAAATPYVTDVPEDVFYVCHVYQQPGATAIYNYANVAGGPATVPSGQSYIYFIHQRDTGALPPDASFQARKLSDFAPTAAIPPSKSVTILKGQGTLAGVLTDFPAVTFTYDAGGTYDGVNSNPATPGAGLARWDGLSVNNLGQLIITQGATAATIGAATVPTLPTTNTLKHVGFVAVINGMTGIYPYQSSVNGTVPAGQGFLQDTVRFNNASLGSGGAATIGPVLAGTQTGTVGGVNYDATDPSGMFTNKGAGAIRTGASTDGSLAEALLNHLPDDLQARLYTAGNTAGIVASTGIGNSVTLVVAGRARTITANAVSPAASGTAGTRWLVADLTAAGVGFTLALATGVPSGTPPTLTTYQKILRSYYWDGATLHDDNASAPDFTPIQTIGSHQTSPDLLTLPRTAPYSTLVDTNLNNTSQLPLAGMSDTYYFAKTCRIEAVLSLIYTMVGAPGTYDVCFRVTVDGTPIPFGDIYQPQTNGLARSVCVQLPIFTVAGNAAHTIAVQAFASSNAASYSTIANTKYLQMKVLN